MDAERWDRIQALFHGALALPEPERPAFLDAESRDDPELLADVLALLEEDAGGASLLDRGLAQVAHETLDAPIPVFRNIGPYRIRSVLGEGGMGVVFLAEREDLQSRVAIKVLRDGTISPARRERFVREEQVLARFSHPSIARLYDADVLPDGTPYFVMEYVEGVPLTTYCTLRRCSVPERLRLFRRVCEAVQYAHRHAIVHRDLKPSNILVREDGQVVLLDFGIAKQLEALEAPAPQTETGLRLMTPAYAAPEQIRGEAVGVHTDVYALGVILYELLVGRAPFDPAGKTPGEMERLILTREPERPSARARRAGDEALLAARRSRDRRAWRDLDVLCLTAMHKDPQRRYSTVEALLRDLDNYLHERPLEARPDTLGYRAGKFLRRNRRPVLAASAVALGVVALVGFYTAQLAEARDAALTEAARTQRIQRFMLGLFEGDEAVGPADSLRVVSLLERGLREADALDAEPVVQAELYSTLGDIYGHLGHFDRADSLLRGSLEQRQALLGPEHPDVARNLVALGLSRSEQADFQEAERLVREGLELSRRVLPVGHPFTAEALTALGKVLQSRGEYQEAIEYLEEAVRLEAVNRPASRELSEALSELANTHFYTGAYAVTDSLNRMTLALDRQLYGQRHPLVANSLINLGAIRFQVGDYPAAEEFQRQALEIKQAYYGGDHHQTAAVMMMLGQALAYQNRFDEALAVLRPALAIRERVYGESHPRVANVLNELANVAQKQGDLATAEANFGRMVEIYRAAYDDEHYLIGIAQANLASVYLESGELTRAEAIYREAIERLTRALSAEHMHTGIVRIKLGRTLLRQSRYADAETELLAGHRIVSAQAQPSVAWLKTAREDLATAYDHLGRPEEAERFRSEADAPAAPGPSR